MKKIFIISTLCLAASVFAVSCQKQEPAGSASGTSNEIQTFSCITPDECEPAVRAQLGGSGNTKVYWNNGDEISFFVNTDNSTGAVYSTTLASPSLQADFTGTGAEQCSAFSNKYIAFYPASQVYSWGTAAEAKRRLRFFIPSEQIAVTNSFPQNCCPMIASADNDSDPLVFSHLAGYFKFTIDESSPSITRIYLTAGDNNWFSGRFTLELSDLTTIGSSSTNRYVIFRNSDDSKLDAGDYYIAVRPRTWTGGFSLTFTDDTGKKAKVTYTATTPEIKKGHVLPIGTVKNLTFKAYNIGDVYKESDENKGVVVALDEDSYYVMSLNEGLCKWSTISPCTLTMSSTTDGSVNTSIIKEAVDADPSDSMTEAAFPSAYYCINYDGGGKGWYLPARDEMKSILMQCMPDEASFTTINSVITGAGGVGLSSTINDPVSFSASRYNTSNISDDKKKSVSVFPSGGNYSQTSNAFSTTRPVRCIKKVSF